MLKLLMQTSMLNKIFSKTFFFNFKQVRKFVFCMRIISTTLNHLRKIVGIKI